MRHAASAPDGAEAVTGGGRKICRLPHISRSGNCSRARDRLERARVSND